jgi:hypothetical protein
VRSDKKAKLIKRIWLAFFIILIINNVVAQTLVAFGQPPGPNPFYGYIPELLPLGYLLAGVLFMLGIIAYRKDFSYAILLISAAALVAGLLNYAVGNTGHSSAVLKIQYVHVVINVRYDGQAVTGSFSCNGQGSIGSFQAPLNQHFCVCIYTRPEVPITHVTWSVGGTIVMSLCNASSPILWDFLTSAQYAGTNIITAEVSDVINGTLYYGYDYVEFRYIPTAGAIYQDVLDALMVDSGISAFAVGFGYNFLTSSISDAINNFVTTPTLGGSGANGDAASFYNYFQQLAISLGFVLIALGIGVNALKGGYSDMVDLGMDFFYRSGVFLLFTYSGIQIYNAIANSLNTISQYIVSSVVGPISNTLAAWTELAIGLLIGSNFIGFGFGRGLTDFAMFIFEIDIAIFAISYIRIVLIFALASLIPLLAAMWTFEWTRGIALALAEILAGLVFGGLVDALILYFAVQVSGLAFFFLAPFMILAYFMTGWGAHQALKSAGLSISSKSTPSSSAVYVGSSSSSPSSPKSPQQQNVPITQIYPPASAPPSSPQQNAPTVQVPVPAPTISFGNSLQNAQTIKMPTVGSSKQRIGNINLTTIRSEEAIKKLGQVSTIRLNGNDKYAVVTAVQGGYRITKGIKTQGGAVEKSYTIPAYVPIEQVARGVEKNYLRKSDTTIDPELIGQFFKSIEGNDENVNSENVKITNVRTHE